MLCHHVLGHGYRNPALTAKMAATLQVLSGGRFMLGIGGGWREDEYLSYGYDFPSASVRLRQLEEVVQICRLMWTEEHPTFSGKYFQIDNAAATPRPDIVPPICIGSSGEKIGLPIVGRNADIWNGGHKDDDDWKRKRAFVDEAAVVAGRDPADIESCVSVAGDLPDSDAAVRTMARPIDASTPSSACRISSWTSAIRCRPSLSTFRRTGHRTNEGVSMKATPDLARPAYETRLAFRRDLAGGSGDLVKRVGVACDWHGRGLDCSQRRCDQQPSAAGYAIGSTAAVVQPCCNGRCAHRECRQRQRRTSRRSRCTVRFRALSLLRSRRCSPVPTSRSATWRCPSEHQVSALVSTGTLHSAGT